MNRVQAGVLVVLTLLAAAPLAAGAHASSAPEDGVVRAIEADSVEFRITVHANASARWTFTYTRVLENASERDQFEAFAEEFERNETAAYRQFERLAVGLTAEGRNATGRDMDARGFSRSAEIGGTCVTRDCGTVTMSFVWTEFAVEDDGRLVVGDVFGSGLYISPDMELVLEAGPGLAFESASPETYNDPDLALSDRQSITYQGERSFADRRPRAVFVPAADGDATTSPGGATTADGTPTDADGGGLPMALVGGLAVLVGAAAAVAWWRSGGAAATTPDAPEDGGTGAAAAGAVSGEPSVADEELLTDEDRVVSLLEANGGRMKQVTIVDETGWSKSKVSMLLSEMEDDDQISKLRVGRENIISLAGHEPDAAGSPHDED